jgi:hypothetical protein
MRADRRRPDDGHPRRWPVASGTLAAGCVDRRRRVRMSEIENLGGVLLEVRRVVPEDSSLRPLIDDLTDGVDVPDVPAGLPGLDAALGGLAGSTPPPDLVYRRVLILAALARALPEPFGWRGDQKKVVVKALRPVTRDGSRRQAEAAHLLISEPVEREQEPREIKRRLIEDGLSRRMLVLETVGTTSTVTSPGGLTRTRLVGTTLVPGYKLKRVKKLLDPINWGKLSGDRITMTPYPAGTLTDGVQQIYYEVFRVSERLKFTPRLRVVTHADGPRESPTARWLEYRLDDVQSQGELVKVDQGSIVIRQIGDDVRIEATKRVLFTPPFDGPGLALQADLLGYFDAFELMVRNALESPSEQE